LKKFKVSDNISFAIIFGALIFYGFFISRNSVIIDGIRYFTLFDDAMISMRYAKNLTAGLGMVWNPGEYVEGYSNFLWTVWMFVLHQVPVHASKFALLVSISGALILVANLFLVKALSEKISGNSPLSVNLSIVLTAFYYGIIYWTLRGMEVGLLTLLVNYSLLIIFNLREKFRALEFRIFLLLLSAIIMTRADSLIIVLALLVSLFFAIKEDIRYKYFLRAIVTVVFVITAQTLFRIYYYGDVLPNTFYLKIGNISYYDRFYRGFDTFKDILLSTLLPALIPVILYLYLSAKNFDRFKVYSLLGILATTSAYSIFVGGDSWEWMPYANRFIAVSIPATLILMAYSIDKIFNDTGKREIPVLLLLIIIPYPLLLLFLNLIFPAKVSFVKDIIRLNNEFLIILAVVILMLFTIVLFSSQTMKEAGKMSFRRKCLALTAIITIIFLTANGWAYLQWIEKKALFVEQDSNNTRLGLKILKNTNTDTRVADVWAGNLPYFSERYSVDLLGKMDKFIAKGEPVPGFNLPGHSKWDHVYSIKNFKPDLILGLREEPSGELQKILSEDYEHIRNNLFVRKQCSKFNPDIFR
jgi:hypothetical protein